MSSEPEQSPHRRNPFREFRNQDSSVVEAEIVGPDEPLGAPSETEQLGRLHPLSLFFDVISHVRSLIIPAIIALLSAAQGSVTGLFIAGFFFVPTLIHSAVKYFSLRYQIRDAELVVTQGIFFRRIRTVPLVRIQNIDLIQNVLHRLFGVAEVRIETASGTEAEATLRVLSLDKIEQLRESIFDRRQPDPVDTNNISLDEFPSPVMPTGEPTSTAPVQTLLTISIFDLMRAGLASNKGNLLLGVLIGVYFQFDEYIESMFDLESWVRSISNNVDTTTMILVVVAGVTAIFFLFRILGIAWYILRFSGYRLTRRNEDFRIECGLLTRVSATVPQKRIQFISIHRNFLMRWMKLAAIRIETAGGASSGAEDATKSVSSRWFIPVLSESRVAEIVAALRPGLRWDENEFDWQPISPKAVHRMIRIAVVLAVLTGLTGLLVSLQWGWLFGVAALPIFIAVAIKKSRSRKFARTNDIVLYRSGVFTQKTSLTFFEKIQTVRIDETPFDRRWEMASLCIDTAAAGPADHRIDIAYLPAKFAKAEFDQIVRQAAGHAPVFS